MADEDPVTGHTDVSAVRAVSGHAGPVELELDDPNYAPRHSQYHKVTPPPKLAPRPTLRLRRASAGIAKAAATITPSPVPAPFPADITPTRPAALVAAPAVTAAVPVAAVPVAAVPVAAVPVAAVPVAAVPVAVSVDLAKAAAPVAEPAAPVRSMAIELAPAPVSFGAHAATVLRLPAALTPPLSRTARLRVGVATGVAVAASLVAASTMALTGSNAAHSTTAAQQAAAQTELPFFTNGAYPQASSTRQVLPLNPVHVANPVAASAPVISGLAANGIPNVALNAYRVAAARMASALPGCGIGWALLAGIGRVESDHGRFGGAQLLSNGTSTKKIIGPALDGVSFPYVGDTDGGSLDGDATYDHAIGPMQFIPGTWKQYAADGNGDGVKDPFNINDEALAAARYLCVAGGNLRTAAGQTAAVLAYNHSDQYLAEVLALAAAYRSGVNVTDIPIVGPTTGALPPIDNGGYVAPANPGPAQTGPTTASNSGTVENPTSTTPVKTAPGTTAPGSSGATPPPSAAGGAGSTAPAPAPAPVGTTPGGGVVVSVPGVLPPVTVVPGPSATRSSSAKPTPSKSCALPVLGICL